MAIALFGPIISGARGKVGGIVFSANRSGPYIKQWSRSSNPRTPAQSTVRNRLGGFSSAWKDLTQAQRDDWDDYADDAAQELTNPLGETYFISGQAWFVRINSHLEEAGAASRDDPPTLTRPLAPIISGIAMRSTSGGNTSQVQLDAASPGLTELHLLTLRLFYSKGRQSATSGFRHMILETETGARFLPFQDEAEAAFGDIPNDSKGFVQVSVQDAHGQRGPVDTANDITADV